jgi:site-specific recombinase XerD
MTTEVVLVGSDVTVLSAATSAVSDRELLASWLASLTSAHSRRNFGMTAERFLGALPCTLRQAKVEDVRRALTAITHGAALATTRQYVFRVKSLLSYGHKLGYLAFNAGVVLKVPPQVRALSKRLVDEVEVTLVIRNSTTERDYLLAAVAYAAGLRVSELVGLNVGDIIRQSSGRVQLHVLGKGGKEREILLPPDLGQQLLAFVTGRPVDAPVFCSSRKGKETDRLTARAVGYLVKRLAKRAGGNPGLSPHWMRHAHASHALERGASLPLVQGTLGHANIATTSVYLHAKPGSASGDVLDPGVWKNRRPGSDVGSDA